MKIWKTLLSAAVLASVTAPAFAFWGFETQEEMVVSANAKAADKLISHMKEKPKDGRPVLVPPLTALDDQGKPTVFGKMAAETIRSELANKGLRILEAKLPKSAGAFGATPDDPDSVKDFLAKQDPAFVVLGTYTVSHEVAYIDLKAVDIKTHEVLSGYTYTIDVSGMSSLFK